MSHLESDDEDEWTFTQEIITREQVESLNKLLAMPWREMDFDYFEEEE